MKLIFELVGGPYCGDEIHQDDDTETWAIPSGFDNHHYLYARSYSPEDYGKLLYCGVVTV